MQIPTDINGLTCFRCDGGFQASLQREPGGGWRVAVAETADEAVREVLDVVPPCPVAIPACPVPLA